MVNMRSLLWIGAAGESACPELVEEMFERCSLQSFSLTEQLPIHS